MRLGMGGRRSHGMLECTVDKVALTRCHARLEQPTLEETMAPAPLALLGLPQQYPGSTHAYNYPGCLGVLWQHIATHEAVTHMLASIKMLGDFLGLLQTSNATVQDVYISSLMPLKCGSWLLGA